MKVPKPSIKKTTLIPPAFTRPIFRGLEQKFHQKNRARNASAFSDDSRHPSGAFGNLRWPSARKRAKRRGKWKRENDRDEYKRAKK